MIASTGADAFYRGEIAPALAAHAAATGGLLTADDLAAHTSTWVDPISVRYRDHEVWELPPNGQGIAALMALGILDGVDMADATPEQRMHWQIEAMKLGFADAHAYVADPDVVAGAGRGPARSGLRGLAPGADHRPGGNCRRPATRCAAAPSTSRAADADGMMVSLIQSNYMGFGSHVVLPGLRLRPAEPRRRLLARSGASERRRGRQAAVPHDHPGLPDRAAATRSARSASWAATCSRRATCRS